VAQQHFLICVNDELSKPIKVINDRRHDYLITSYELPQGFFGIYRHLVM
jgi:hypothetical protein